MLNTKYSVYSIIQSFLQEMSIKIDIIFVNVKKVNDMIKLNYRNINASIITLRLE